MEPIKDTAVRTLRWSEQYTKTDMVYLTSGGFWLFAAKVIALAIGFALSIAFANLMEPEKYGVYKYVLSLVTIGGTFALVGMGSAVNHAVARGYEGALQKGFATYLIWSIGGVIITAALAAYYFYNNNWVIGFSLLLGGTFTPLISAASLYDNYLGGAQQFRIKTWYNALRSTVPATTLIVVLFFTSNPLLLTALYFISTFAASYFCYRDVIGRFKPHDKTDDNTLTFSKHLSVLSIITTVIAQLDRVLIFSHLGGTSLAVYAFSEAGPDQLRGLGSIIGSLAFPQMSKRSFAEIRASIARKALIVFGIGSALALIYILLVPTLFALFFPRYLAAIPYTQAYALIVPLALTSVLFNQALLSHMKKRELYINNILPQIVRVGMLVTLVYLYGIWGVIIGTLLYYVMGMALLLWTFYTVKI